METETWTSFSDLYSLNVFFSSLSEKNIKENLTILTITIRSLKATKSFVSKSLFFLTGHRDPFQLKTITKQDIARMQQIIYHFPIANTKTLGTPKSVTDSILA